MAEQAGRECTRVCSAPGLPNVMAPRMMLRAGVLVRDIFGLNLLFSFWDWDLILSEMCQSTEELTFAKTPARLEPREQSLRALRAKAANDDTKGSRQTFRKMPSCVSAGTPSSSPFTSTIFPFTTLRIVIPVNRIFRPVSAGSAP